MQKTLAFFGAFNPPTCAHLRLAEAAMRAAGALGVVFVPSKAAYITETQKKDFAYGDARRIRMLEAAAAARPWMRVSPVDILSPRQPYTYDSLCRLRQEGLIPSLLVGSDQLKAMEGSWRRPREIAAEFGIVCVLRGGDSRDGLLFSSAFLRGMERGLLFVDMPADVRHVSSSEIRRQLTRGRTEEARRGVPPEVYPLLFPLHEKEMEK